MRIVLQVVLMGMWSQVIKVCLFLGSKNSRIIHGLTPYCPFMTSQNGCFAFSNEKYVCHSKLTFEQIMSFESHLSPKL